MDRTVRARGKCVGRKKLEGGSEDWKVRLWRQEGRDSQDGDGAEVKLSVWLLT